MALRLSERLSFQMLSFVECMARTRVSKLGQGGDDNDDT